MLIWFVNLWYLKRHLISTSVSSISKRLGILFETLLENDLEQFPLALIPHIGVWLIILHCSVLGSNLAGPKFKFVLALTFQTCKL